MTPPEFAIAQVVGVCVPKNRFMFQAEAALLRRSSNRPQLTYGGSIRVYGTRKGRQSRSGQRE
jgi:hypothetical protein